MISQQAIYLKHFQALCQLANRTLPHHRVLAQNLSLVLINSNAVLQYPRAYLPNMLEIGGVHLKSQLPLPQVSFVILCCYRLFDCRCTFSI